MAVTSNSRDILSGQNTVFVFQYNPESLTRVISSSEIEDTTDFTQRQKKATEPPVENIHLTLELDATDQLENPALNSHLVENGLLPSLSVLESMILLSGESRLIVFLWGPKRNIPVRLTSYRIMEEAFDQSLNPIRVRIDLCMRVLSLSDFKSGSVGHRICRKYLNQKRELALLYRAMI